MVQIEKSTKLVSHESSKVVLFRYNAVCSRHGRLELPPVHQAEIVIVKHLLQGHNNVTKMGVKPRSCNQRRRKNGCNSTQNLALPCLMVLHYDSVLTFTEVKARRLSPKLDQKSGKGARGTLVCLKSRQVVVTVRLSYEI